MKHRLFIAINLPEPLKKRLAKLILELERRNKGLPVKWTNPEGLHLTLHFLGYLEEQQIPQVEKILEKVNKNCPPFIMRLDNIDVFPNFDNPRIIFVDCGKLGGGKACSIQKAIGEELEKGGFDVESRPWHEHVTIARVKDKCQLNIPRVEMGESDFEVRSIELMESQLTPGGAKYRVVKSFKLG
ncbi:RNA 2',3'-cyclic phosphodiesterase [Patescibacteria group bacterium]|nr:RNA 2',3'-cyclic phosphodiesterase [Patescibacteria group bacterium]MBU4512968.1 RNA 2',3'-cyclic phosphodiesterase [Patescibacteria group bacterium]MCG2693004.1 RNA 2',3'-cyclic phosphodiesterase [Candidatus Parcubacteria bacterium]